MFRASWSAPATVDPPVRGAAARSSSGIPQPIAQLQRECAARPEAPASFAVATRAILPPFVASRLLFILITITAPWWIAVFHLPQAALAAHDGLASDLWYRWDSIWYMRVATDGYSTIPYANHHLNLAFFPLYPLLLHACLQLWPWSPVLLAMLLANLCFVAASFYLYRLVALEFGAARAGRVIWLLALFPTSLFFYAGYSEALFLLCLVLSFSQLRLQHWWWAGVWGGLAAATRPLGIILIVPFLIYWFQAQRGLERDAARDDPTIGPMRTVRRLAAWHRATRWVRERRRGGSSLAVRLSLPALALIPLGLLAYMVYLQARFGNALAFSSSQHSWHRSWAWPWQTLGAALTRPLAHLPHPNPQELHAISDTIWAIVFLSITLRAVRSLPGPYAAYLWLFWAIVLSTPALLDGVPDPLISLPRFLLTAFPLFIFLAATRRRALIAGLISAPLLVFSTIIFVSGGWVA